MIVYSGYSQACNRTTDGIIEGRNFPEMRKIHDSEN